MNDSFKGKLEVGGRALIIGCHHPENSHVIGMVVDVVGLVNQGERLPDWFLSPLGKLVAKEYEYDTLECDGVLIAADGFNHDYWISNHGLMEPKHLMPLGDDTLDLDKEMEDSPYLEKAEA